MWLPTLALYAEISKSDAWQRAAGSKTEDETGELWRWRANPTRGVLQVLLFPDIKFLLATPDNRGERDLLRMVLQGLRRLLPGDAQKAWPDDRLAEIVERYAPLGLKKFLVAFDDAPPDFDPRGLPPARKVQEADIEDVADDLGAFLLTEAGRLPGIVPDEKRDDVLKLAVDYLYDQFRQLVWTLRPDELLEMLLAFHEAWYKSGPGAH
jgi:hypothetical protein